MLLDQSSNSRENSQSLHILMTTNRFWPLVGGAEEQARKLGKELVARDHRVTYVTARFPELEKHEQIDGIHVYRLPFPRERFMGKYIAHPIFFLSFLIFLLRNRKQFDVFHSHGVFSIHPTFAIVLAGKILGKPTVVKYASLFEKERARSAFLGALLYKIVNRFATMFVGNSRIVYEKLRNDCGLTKEKCVCIPNGVEIPSSVKGRGGALRRQLNLPVESEIVTCVASFGSGKNQIAAIRAWPDVLADFPSAHLVFLGDGKEFQRCVDETLELGLCQRVLFQGEVLDVRAYLEASDLFLFPSNYPEGMSNALLEAMAIGLPCAVSNIPQNTILIQNGENGLTFDPMDLDGLRNAVVRLLEDRVLAKSLGERARKTVEQSYSIEHITDRYLNLYFKLCCQIS